MYFHHHHLKKCLVLFSTLNLHNESFESISYITDERVIQSAKEYLYPVTLLPSSHTEGNNELDVIGNCFTRSFKVVTFVLSTAEKIRFIVGLQLSSPFS